MDATSWGRVERILTGALERAHSEREAYVREQCSDPHLCDELVTIVTEELPQGQPDSRDVDAAMADDDFEPGMRIGPYVILDRIGRGGMGVVLLGNDPRLRRRVALKCIIQSLTGTDEHRDRILHEARAAARVNHPNIATIHDVVEHNGRAFIVMEYLEGESLASRIKHRRLPLEQVIAIGRQLSEALAAAHARGVVHRDLKPANIQLTLQGTVKVLDFGIANLPRTISTSDETALPTRTAVRTTAPRSNAGTPPYMSPEQLLGRSVDERSDLYSLGVVLFELATGRRPFLEADRLGLLVEQAKGAPRADDIDSTIPRTFGDVLAKALGTDATRRYQTAAALATDLERLANSLASRREPSWKRIARGLVGAAGLMLVVLVVGVVATAGFNLTFGLSSSFAADTLTSQLVWGFRALLPSAFLMTLIVLACVVVGLLLGLLEHAAPARLFMRRSREVAQGVAAALSLDKPAGLAQALCVIAIVGLAIIVWRHAALVAAWGADVNSSSADLRLLGPNHMREKTWYRQELDVLLLMTGFGLYKLLQMRKRMRPAEGTVAFAVLVAMMVILVLMNEWPYRVFYHNRFERIDFGAVRCYITGTSVGQFQIFCPTNAPPRNRVISRSDPNIKRSGIFENVFAPLDSIP